MVIAIKKFFEKYVKSSPDCPDEVSEHSLRIATTALLIEMMRADAEITEDERRMVMKIITTKFDLAKEESKALLQFAEEEIRKATGYYEFTSLINRGFTYEQKVKVIENLWEIAFSDKSLDKYEEHMVRKIADLIYVAHKDFIDAKLRVKKRLSL
jgi:uncharacterized tellurite resistance protein B-like protein